MDWFHKAIKCIKDQDGLPDQRYAIGNAEKLRVHTASSTRASRPTTTDPMPMLKKLSLHPCTRSALRTLAFLSALGSSAAMACVCSPGEAKKDPLQEAAIAFVGRPVRIEVLPRPEPPTTWWQSILEAFPAIFGEPVTPVSFDPPRFLDSVRVTFEVSEYMKGRGPDRIDIMTGYGDADCGLPVSISKKYTIYAREMEGELRTSYCFGSAVFVRRRVELTCGAGEDVAGIKET